MFCFVCFGVLFQFFERDFVLYLMDCGLLMPRHAFSAVRRQDLVDASLVLTTLQSQQSYMASSLCNIFLNSFYYVESSSSPNCSKRHFGNLSQANIHQTHEICTKLLGKPRCASLSSQLCEKSPGEVLLALLRSPSFVAPRGAGGARPKQPKRENLNIPKINYVTI